MSEPVYTTAFSADHQMANIPETGSTSICLRNLVNTVWQNAEGVSRPRPEGADAGRSLLGRVATQRSESHESFTWKGQHEITRNHRTPHFVTTACVNNVTLGRPLSGSSLAFFGRAQSQWPVASQR